MIKAFLAAFLSLFTLGMNRLDVHQPRTSSKIVYDQSSSISQSFISHANNLNIVSICIRNRHRVLEPLQFNLYEATTSSPPVRTLKFSSGNIDNQDCTRFQFELISNSKGKQYLASIVRLNASQKKRSPIYIEAYHDEDYLEGTAFKDDVPLNQDLHFKTFYRQPLNQAIKGAAINFIQRIFADPLFFLFYSLLLTLIIRHFHKINKND